MEEDLDNIPQAEIIRFSWPTAERNNKEVSIKQEVLMPGQTIVVFTEGTVIRVENTSDIPKAIETGLNEGKNFEIFAHMSLQNQLLISAGPKNNYGTTLEAQTRIIPLEYGDTTSIVGILGKDKKEVSDIKRELVKQRMQHLEDNN